MRIISEKTETQFVPIPVSEEGAKILLSKQINKYDGTCLYIADQHLLTEVLTKWLARKLLYKTEVKVTKEEDRDPTLEELGEIAMLYVYYYTAGSPSKQIPNAKLLIDKYPEFSPENFFGIVEKVSNKIRGVN